MSGLEGPRLVVAFAEIIASERDPAVVWPAMLRMLEESVGFDSGYIAASWTTAMQGRGAIIGHDEPFMKRNLGRMLAQISPEELARYTDHARCHDDVWAPSRRRQLAVFNEVLDPANVKKMMVRVSVRHGNIAGYNLERRGVGPSFSDRDLALVDMIAPFLHIFEVLSLDPQDGQETRRFAAENGLSRREAEFLELTVRGLQNSEIAMLTGVSINTVRNTLVKVYEKAGVTNRSELAYIATRRPLGLQGRSGPQSQRHPAADDGFRTFAERVEAISKNQNPETSSGPRVAASSAHIVYTPPLGARPQRSA
ncbi:MAG TPA: LuxR C-terminal-related transcriptional regulator [Polyangia bacterium]